MSAVLIPTRFSAPVSFVSHSSTMSVSSISASRRTHLSARIKIKINIRQRQLRMDHTVPLQLLHRFRTHMHLRQALQGCLLQRPRRLQALSQVLVEQTTTPPNTPNITGKEVLERVRIHMQHTVDTRTMWLTISTICNSSSNNNSNRSREKL